MPEVGALDLYYLLKEFSLLKNSILQKIHHIPELNLLKLSFYVRNEGEKTLIILPDAIYFSSYKIQNPLHPSNFCSLLRKHLLRKRLLELRQVKFERILEFGFFDRILIIELFSKGNVILCDRDYTIIAPMKQERWKDRTIKPKEKYKYPPEKLDVRGLNFSEFKRLFLQTNKNIISFLASDLNFGKKYANEIFSRVGIEEKERLDDIELEKVYEEARRIFELEVEPRLYFGKGGFADFSPFPLKIYSLTPSKKLSSFSEALDEFFMEKLEKSLEGGEEEKKAKILEKQKEALKLLKRRMEENRAKAEIIRRNYLLIKKVMDEIKILREKNLPWAEIKGRLKNEKVKEIDEKNGRIIFEMEGEEIEIDFTKSLERNIEDYFEKAKKAKRKIEGAKKAIEEIKRKELKAKRKIVIEKKEKRKKPWYENFRWFHTSDGFLVVIGKDASTNEILIKKYLEKDDLVLHAEIIGSPFGIIKEGRKKISAQAIKEAAEFVACYSKAWEQGLGSIAVYWVFPEQVSKKPPSGMYLPKGSFMIYGNKNYLKNVPLRLAIGIKMGDEGRVEVIALPAQAAKKSCTYFVTIGPGLLSSFDLAKKIKMKFLKLASAKHREIIERIELEKIARLIPFGKGDIYQS